jgi:hypothetical protein
MKFGTEAHKELFCRSFMESHLHYEPEQLPFPELDDEQLTRLRSIPFWYQALTTERRAGVMVSTFAETIDDPLIRNAIALQGQEETRHGRLLEHLIRFYGISVPEAPKPQVPKNLQQAFVHFGFEECLDSFFAFGMFGLARQAQYLPESIFTIFEPILDEEARHIVFFVNWITYLQIHRGRGFLSSGNALWNYGQALLGLVKTMASSQSNDKFTVTGAKTFVNDLTIDQVFEMCLRENDRRMSQFDDRLLQPKLLPRLSAIALKVLRSRPRRPELATTN